MGVPSDEVVQIRLADAAGDPAVVTVSCPDKTGLGCDLCRTILEFGLRITRGGTRPVLVPSISLSGWNSVCPSSAACLQLRIE